MEGGPLGKGFVGEQASVQGSELGGAGREVVPGGGTVSAPRWGKRGPAQGQLGGDATWVWQSLGGELRDGEDVSGQGVSPFSVSGRSHWRFLTVQGLIWSIEALGK